MVGYKYFDLENTKKITVEARGRGVLLVRGRQLPVQSDSFTPYACAPTLKGEQALYFKVLSGKIDLLSFTLE